MSPFTPKPAAPEQETKSSAQTTIQCSCFPALAKDQASQQEAATLDVCMSSTGHLVWLGSLVAKQDGKFGLGWKAHSACPWSACSNGCRQGGRRTCSGGWQCKGEDLVSGTGHLKNASTRRTQVFLLLMWLLLMG